MRDTAAVGEPAPRLVLMGNNQEAHSQTQIKFFHGKKSRHEPTCHHHRNDAGRWRLDATAPTTGTRRGVGDSRRESRAADDGLIVFARLGPGETLGESGIMHNAPHLYSARTRRRRRCVAVADGGGGCVVPGRDITPAERSIGRVVWEGRGGAGGSPDQSSRKESESLFSSSWRSCRGKCKTRRGMPRVVSRCGRARARPHGALTRCVCRRVSRARGMIARVVVLRGGCARAQRALFDRKGGDRATARPLRGRESRAPGVVDFIVWAKPTRNGPGLSRAARRQRRRRAAILPRRPLCFASRGGARSPRRVAAPAPSPRVASRVARSDGGRYRPAPPRAAVDLTTPAGWRAFGLVWLLSSNARNETSCRAARGR